MDADEYLAKDLIEFIKTINLNEQREKRDSTYILIFPR